MKNFLREKVSDKAILILGIVLLCAYYFIGLLSYITVPIAPLFRLFKSSSIIAILLRMFTCGLICLYSFLVIVKYKPKIQWFWLILFAFTLLMTLICILISPLTYEYMYVENLYKVVHIVIINPGLGRTIVMYLSSIADFAFAFCIMFILPLVINDKKKILWLLLPIVFIGLLECCYSLLKERGSYIYLLNNSNDPFGGYNNGIGATFGNKEDWGAFLIISISSAFASFFFLDKNKKNVWLKVGLLSSIFIMSIFTVLSLCKTAILALIFIYIFIGIGLDVVVWQKNKKSGLTILCVYLGIILMIILFFATKGFGVGILRKISNYASNLIIGRSQHAIEGRMSLWVNYMQNIRGYNFFFGMGKNYVNAYTKSLVMEGQASIHNGLVYFFASYGLIGFIIFFSLLMIVIKNILKNWKTEKFFVFLFLGILFAALTFVLAESEVLIISTSTPIFIYNVLLVILPSGFLLKHDARKKEDYSK